MLNDAVNDIALDNIEQVGTKLDIISSFASRGWALYEVGDLKIRSLLDLKPCITAGRARSWLHSEVRYAVLPLVKHSWNPNVVLDTMRAIIGQQRGPYFVDLREDWDDEANDGFVEPVGVYLIDSIFISPPFLDLIIDKFMSKVKDPECSRGDSIRIHLSELYKIRQQLQIARRVI